MLKSQLGAEREIGVTQKVYENIQKKANDNLLKQHLQGYPSFTLSELDDVAREEMQNTAWGYGTSESLRRPPTQTSRIPDAMFNGSYLFLLSKHEA